MKKNMLDLLKLGSLAAVVAVAVILLITGKSRTVYTPDTTGQTDTPFTDEAVVPTEGAGFTEIKPPLETAVTNQIDRETTTLMIYMIGSDLESRAGAAAKDLEEIRNSGVDLKRCNVLVYAGGTEFWHTEAAENGKLTLLRLTEHGWEQQAAEEARSMGEPDCLAGFLDDCVRQWPADHYALVLWNHGNGPVIGYGKDTAFSDDSLTLSEMRLALEASPFSPELKLDWVGFDACLMSSAELCCIWKDYAKLLAASQETEPCLGWDYGFLSRLGTCDPQALLCDMTEGYLAACLSYYDAKGYAGDDTTLAVLDLGCADRLTAALDDLFAAAEPDALLQFDRFAAKRANTRAIARSTTGSEYDLVDLRDLASALAEDYPEQAGALLAATDEMVLHNATNAEGLSGLSLYYPFFNKSYYTRSWAEDYRTLGIFDSYLAFLDAYAVNWLYEGSPADYTVPKTPEQVSEGVFTLQLDEAEAAQFASARYYILYREGDELYKLLFTGSDVTNEDGLLTANFDGNIIYGVTDHGEIFTPVTIQRDTVGDRTTYAVEVFLENWTPEFEYSHCYYHIVLDRTDGSVQINTLLPVENDTDADAVIGGKLEEPDLSAWTKLLFNDSRHQIMRRYNNGTLMGWDSWDARGAFSAWEFPTTEGITFSMLPICYGDYAIVFEVRDTHGDTWCSEPLELQAAPKPIVVEPRIPAPEPVRTEWNFEQTHTVFENETVRMTLRQDVDSWGDPGLYCRIENLTDRSIHVESDPRTVVNGSFQVSQYFGGTIEAHESKDSEIPFGDAGRYGLFGPLDSLAFTFDVTDSATEEYLLFGQPVEVVFTDSPAPLPWYRQDPVLSPFRGASASGQTLVEAEDYSVRLITLGKSPISDDSLACILYVENRSELELCLGCDGFALNGIFVGGSMPELSVAPGKSAWCFPECLLFAFPGNAQIPEIADAQICLRISRNNQTLWIGDGTPEWFEIALEEKAAAPAPFVPGDLTLYEENGVRLALRSADQGGAYEGGDYSQTWYLTVENDTDLSISVEGCELTVDGIETRDSVFFEKENQVGPHQRTVMTVQPNAYASDFECPVKQIRFIPKIMNFTGTAELWRADSPVTLTVPEESSESARRTIHAAG